MQQTRLLEGLQIMKDYAGDGWIAANHDQIWFGTDEGPDEMNPEDVKKLDELGFFWDEEIDRWSCFT